MTTTLGKISKFNEILSPRLTDQWLLDKKMLHVHNKHNNPTLFIPFPMISTPIRNQNRALHNQRLQLSAMSSSCSLGLPAEQSHKAMPALFGPSFFKKVVTVRNGFESLLIKDSSEIGLKLTCNVNLLTVFIF